MHPSDSTKITSLHHLPELSMHIRRMGVDIIYWFTASKSVCVHVEQVFGHKEAVASICVSSAVYHGPAYISSLNTASNSFIAATHTFLWWCVIPSFETPLKEHNKKPCLLGGRGVYAHPTQHTHTSKIKSSWPLLSNSILYCANQAFLRGS